MVWIFLVLLVIVLYLIIIIVLEKSGWLKRHNLSLAGPILLIRTKRGRKFIDKVARGKSGWKWFGNISIVICSVLMVSMSILLVWESWIVLQIPKEALPTPRMMIGIPVLNPIIPLGYGLLGLVVAIVVHEFTHGILASAGEIKVKSLGLMLCVLPIGAFTEPDEEQLNKISRARRARVFASGPTMNLLVALLCALIFSWVFMGSAAVKEGVCVTGVVKGSPAEGKLKPGMVIKSIDNQTLDDVNELIDFMNTTSPGEEVKLLVSYKGESYTYPVILGNKYNYTKDDKDNGTGFLGVGDSSKWVKHSLTNPLSSRKSLLIYITLPFLTFTRGFAPTQAPFVYLYELQGPLSLLPTNVFWMFANVFYWVFWLNFMIGTFNALPMLPLDGGYIFKDGVDAALYKVDKKRREKIATKAAHVVAILLWGLILWIIIGPRVV